MSPSPEPTRLLHIVATPRAAHSTTLGVAEVYLDELVHHVPDLEVTTLDLFRSDLPAVAGTNIDVKYNLLTGVPPTEEQRESWHAIEELIATFTAADRYLISTPMWNFGIPYALKYYIDCLVQPGYLFGFNAQGIPIPLLTGKKMVVVTARGSSYEPESPLHAFDFQEPYLRAIFGFVGIFDIEFVIAQPVDVPGMREGAVAAAKARARAVAASASGAPEPAAV
jgi:FMN-dependent NADH-azoreductase